MPGTFGPGGDRRYTYVRNFSRRFLVVAAVGALASLMVVVIVAAASARPRAGGTRAATPRTTTTVRAKPSTTTTKPAPTTPIRPRKTATIPLTRVLNEGATGADVFLLQARLLQLGYWLRDAPGTFGPATAHAVVAFEKATGFARDGIVDAAEFRKLQAAKRFPPRGTEVHGFEVDLQRQVLLDVDNGRTTWVFDTSTGRIPGTTPSGNFHMYQQVDGWVHGTLGTLYRPKFFAGNVGIHGSPSIPPYPASHGCVRMFNAAMDWIWASGDLSIGTAVWVY